MRALLVEDNPVLADGVSRAFALAGLTLDHASDLSSARAFLREFTVDIVLLDLTLPDGDGMTLLGEMRDRDDKTPVLILTARDNWHEKVTGIDSGADDYLTKPFSPKELILRVKAILKRNRITPGSSTFSHGPFHFDKDTLGFFLNDEPLTLSLIEYKLLLYLCQRPGQPQDRNDLLKVIWGYSDDIHSRTLDTHMKRLRQKLGQEGTFLETIRGIGYQIRQSE